MHEYDPLILVTNDDGYDAPGIGALVAAASPLGRVIVAAPDREQSASSHSLTLDRPLRVRRVGEDHYRIDGTPTDCVHLAFYSLTDARVPDLVLSGINRGLNVGDDVTYSGTVAGAVEGALLGAASVAFSAQVDADGQTDYARQTELVRRICRSVLERGLDPGTLLNVNFPLAAARGVRITRQGTRTYRATAQERLDPTGRPYFWIDSVDMTPTGEADSDHTAIGEGFVSISPLHVNLTYEPFLKPLTEWKLELP